MPTRPILIVTPYFAPQSHAAVYRAHKLAKYLPQYGWTPHVITVGTNYVHGESPEMLQDLPEAVRIHRARYVEPTLRGLRMALGGQDTTLTAQVPQLAGGSSKPGQPSKTRRLYNYLLNRWIQVPDAHWTWIRPAVQLARRLIEDHDISVVYSTSPPYSSNLIGISLRRAGCRWVADLRDPIGYGSKGISRYEPVAAIQREIVRKTLKSADVVVGAAASFNLIFKDMFPEARKDVRYIPTGLDESLLPAGNGAPPKPWPYLIYVGEFLEEYDDYFLEALSLALRDPVVRSSGIRVIVVGHQVLNPARLGPRLRKYSLENVIEFLPHMPQTELYRLVRGATACLLIPGHSIFWWCHYAKMVDYLALRKPVVAVVPDPSEARSTLSKAGLGVFLDGDVPTAAAILTRFLQDPAQQKAGDDEICARHTAKRQVESFVEIFEELRAR